MLVASKLFFFFADWKSYLNSPQTSSELVVAFLISSRQSQVNQEQPLCGNIHQDHTYINITVESCYPSKFVVSSRKLSSVTDWIDRIVYSSKPQDVIKGQCGTLVDSQCLDYIQSCRCAGNIRASIIWRVSAASHHDAIPEYCLSRW